MKGIRRTWGKGDTEPLVVQENKQLAEASGSFLEEGARLCVGSLL